MTDTPTTDHNGTPESPAFPPALKTLLRHARAFSAGLGEIDYRALEVEAEELDRANLAEIVTTLDTAGDDMRDALERLRQAVSMYSVTAAVDLIEAKIALAAASAELARVCDELHHQGGDQ